MDAPKNDVPKLPDMVMCGDHPSFTKTELNVKTDTIKVDEKDKEKVKEKVLSYAKITPSGSRTERTERMERTERSERCEPGEARSRAASEHALCLSEARRRVRELEGPRPDVQAVGNQALVQGCRRGVPLAPLEPALQSVLRRVCPTAALGSFRWPPYLLCVWVLVLLLTHALHCLVSLLERALPALRKCSQFFRSWTEAAWRGSLEPGSGERSPRVVPAGLALLTAALYALYWALYAAYAVVLWAIEPLCADDDKRDADPKVTNYDDDFNTSSCHKP